MSQERVNKYFTVYDSVANVTIDSLAYNEAWQEGLRFYYRLANDKIIIYSIYSATTKKLSNCKNKQQHCK